MGFYQDRVLPGLIDLVLGTRAIGELRQRVVADLDGEVLEVGFGSGLNVPYYPAGVDRMRVVDPSAGGRKLAAKRIAASRVPIEFVGLDGQDLPLGDNTVDHVLTTWTLCTIPDAERALAEMHRVVRPGGTLHFLEHGRAPQPRLAKWQDRLTPLQRRIGGGCHINRQIDELISGSGFEIKRMENYFLDEPPKLTGYMFEGIATKQ